MAADLSKLPSVPLTPSAADSRAARPVPQVSEAEIDEMHAAMVERSRLLFKVSATSPESTQQPTPPRKHLRPGFVQQLGQEIVANLRRQFGKPSARTPMPTQMPNREQALALVRQGVGPTNAWRRASQPAPTNPPAPETPAGAPTSGTSSGPPSPTRER